MAQQPTGIPLSNQAQKDLNDLILMNNWFGRFFMRRADQIVAKAMNDTDQRN
jgi:hypothetical protein